MLRHLILVALSVVAYGCISQRPQLVQDPVRIAVHQHNAAPVPGAKGDILVRLGDITGGQVMLSVERASGDILVEPRSVRDGDVIPFPMGGRTHYVTVIRLANYLVGDDFGEFELSATPPSARSAAVGSACP